MITFGLVFAKRLRDARLRAKLTQEGLAAAAGFDEFSASARLSQYETGKHVPRFEIALQLAKAMDIPVEYFYARDDRTAAMLLLWNPLPDDRKVEVMSFMSNGGIDP